MASDDAPFGILKPEAVMVSPGSNGPAHDGPQYNNLRLSLDEPPYTPPPTSAKKETGPGMLFGWGRFTPKFLQVFNTPRWLLVFMCIIAILNSAVTLGFIPIILSTLEARFGLNSTQSAVLVITYDIFGCIVVPIVSYYGDTAHKGRWIGLGTLMFGLGCIVFSLPHFTTGLYPGTLTADEKNDSLCQAFGGGGSQALGGGGGSNSYNYYDYYDYSYYDYNYDFYNTTYCLTKETNLSNYLYLFVFAQFLLCMSSGPMYTMGVAYLDEHVETEYSGLYIAILYAMSSIGPGIGTIMCGEIINLWIDWPTKDGGSLMPTDSSWIGNWWLGFPIVGCVTILFTLPLLAYPRKLPVPEDFGEDVELEATRKTDDDVIATHEYDADPTNADQAPTKDTAKDFVARVKIGLREFKLTLGVLVKNPTFMFLTFAGAIDALGYSGIFTFSPKLSELMLDTNVVNTSWYFGVSIVAGDVLGALFGGWITKQLGVNCKKMMTAVVALSLLSQLGNLIFLMYCQDAPRVTLAVADSMNCTYDCLCDPMLYDPVCGSNGVEYFSACQAGCTVYDPGNLTYSSCTCITDYWLSQNVTSGVTSSATSGTCPRNCISWIMPFYFVVVTLLGFVALATIPMYTEVTLRIIPDDLRSFALGVQWTVIKVVGLIPGSLIFGAVIDLSCIQWEDNCGKRGSCLTYDNRQVGLNVFILSAVVGAIAMFLYAMAWWTCPKEEDEELEGEQADDARNDVLFDR